MDRKSFQQRSPNRSAMCLKALGDEEDDGFIGLQGGGSLGIETVSSGDCFTHSRGIFFPVLLLAELPERLVRKRREGDWCGDRKRSRENAGKELPFRAVEWALRKPVDDLLRDEVIAEDVARIFEVSFVQHRCIPNPVEFINPDCDRLLPKPSTSGLGVDRRRQVKSTSKVGSFHSNASTDCAHRYPVIHR